MLQVAGLSIFKDTVTVPPEKPNGPSWKIGPRAEKQSGKNSEELGRQYTTTKGTNI